MAQAESVGAAEKVGSAQNDRSNRYSATSRRRIASNHRLARGILGCERRSCPRAVLDWRHRRHNRNGRFHDLDRLHDYGLHSILHLCRDRGPLSEQIGRRFGLWRGSLGALLEIHRAAVGVVQLVRLVARAVARLLHRRRLHPQCACADPAGRTRPRCSPG